MGVEGASVMTGLKSMGSVSTARRTGSAITSKDRGALNTILKVGSIGEETLALHLRAHNISFDREVMLVPVRKWRWDFVVGDLAIEIQGGTWARGGHSRGLGQIRDCQKQNAAVRAGYRPLAFTTDMVTSGEAINDLLEILKKPHSTV